MKIIFITHLNVNSNNSQLSLNDNGLVRIYYRHVRKREISRKMYF